MPDTLESRVARGARWLDEKVPGWYKRIDLSTLLLEEEFNCICGQLWSTKGLNGQYVRGGFEFFSESHLYSQAQAWLLEEYGIDVENTMLVSHGRFSTTSDYLGFDADFEGEHEKLDVLWHDLIVQRLKEDAEHG